MITLISLYTSELEVTTLLLVSVAVHLLHLFLTGSNLNYPIIKTEYLDYQFQLGRDI